MGEPYAEPGPELADGGNDVMELVGDYRATEPTKAMLEDTFLQGFLFTLVQEKWDRFTAYAFYSLRATEFVYLSMVLWISFLLKHQPSTRAKMLAICIIVASAILTVIELFKLSLWWRNDATRSITWAAFKVKVTGVIMWANAFSTRAKLAGLASATVAATYYLITADDARHDSKSDAPLYFLLGLSSYVQGKSFIAHICVSPKLPKLGVQMIIIDKMFNNDVMIYLLFLSFFLLNYFFAM